MGKSNSCFLVVGAGTGGRVMSESRVIYKYILGESNVIEIPENPIF